MKFKWVVIAAILIAPCARAADEPAKPPTSAPAPAPVPMQRKSDVIYGRLPGIALTMDVFSPGKYAKNKANGAAVVWVVSGGWASAHESIDNKFFGKSLAELFIQPLVDRGYTVFAVVHASQPKYTIPEIIPQLNRAVRYIRYNAKDYGIDGNRIGIIGASAGGHLSLMQGMSPEPPNDKSPDPVDREKSNIQCVAAFVPPTDFLNYGGPGENGLGKGRLSWLRAPFEFVAPTTAPSTFSPQGQTVYERITDEKLVEAIGKKISPIYHVDAKDPPTLILAGEVDVLVPLQQMQTMKAKLDEMKVPNELIVRKGANHAWPEMGDDMQKVADWYDRYLVVEKK